MLHDEFEICEINVKWNKRIDCVQQESGILMMSKIHSLS